MLVEALQSQFAKAFGILEAAIPSFTPEQWRAGAPPYDGPARAVMHVLQCAEFYTSEDQGIWCRFGKGVWEMADVELPTQQEMATYLAEARGKTAAWISMIGDAGLPEPVGGPAPVTKLERIVYAIRHLQHHTGEVCAYQKRCGIEPAPWG